ncbi:hypothetical protein [Demequina sp.]|uniref:hypothetical protein n=1 Tax=Demequina sp. TaxID=2050685 RepID=UPI003D0FD35D
MPKALKIAAALMVALASAAIGWFGVKWWQDSRDVAAPSLSPTPSASASDIAYVHLTFDLDAVVEQASGLVERPACGDEWAGAPAVANGVLITADVEQTQENGVDALAIGSYFTPEGQDPVAFLGAEGYYVVTRDGKVVSPDWGAEYVPQYYVAIPGSKTLAGEGVSLTGPTLCDVADELAEIWAGIDFGTATDEEIQAAQEATEAFNEANAALPSGKYEIWAVAPVLLGEEAAIARALSDEGVSNIGTLSYSIGSSPLRDDPRLADYCTDELDENGEAVARNCDVPADVLKEVLARDVPQVYVVEGPAALAVSEPVAIEIP